MLHITNGESAVQTLRKAGVIVPGDGVIAWNDVLHEGPVPSTLTLPELSEVRAEFIDHQGWGDLARAREDFKRRDTTLEYFAQYAETILWFEADLYDQLQLLQILDFFATRNPAGSGLSLVCSEQYVSSYSADQAQEALRERRPVSPSQLALAEKAWRAFRSANPGDIKILAESDLTPLPYLKNALLRLLAEYPSERNGLGQTEQNTLEAIFEGENVVRKIYLAAHHARETFIYLGDTIFASYLESMSQCEDPLLLFENGERVKAPRWNEDAAAFWEASVLLTDFGRAVMNGEADQISRNGIERWIGGVRLEGKGPCWRRRSASEELIKI